VASNYNPLNPIPGLFQQIATPGYDPTAPIPTAGGIQYQRNRQQQLMVDRLNRETQQQVSTQPIEQTQTNLLEQREQRGHELQLQREQQAHDLAMQESQQQHEQQQAVADQELARRQQLGSEIQEEQKKVTKPFRELGTGGKIGRIAGIAGGVLFPGWTSRIPGTPLYEQQKLQSLQEEADKQQQLASEEMSAQARMIEAMTAKHGQPVQMRVGNKIVLGHLDPNDPTSLQPFVDEQGQLIEAGLPRQFQPVPTQVTHEGQQPIAFEPSTGAWVTGNIPGGVEPTKGPAETAAEQKVQAYIHDPSNARALGLAPGESFEGVDPARQAHMRDVANKAIAQFAPGPFVPLLPTEPGQPSLLYNPLHGMRRQLPPGYQSPQEQTVLDRSYNQNFQALQKIRQPIDFVVGRMSMMQTTLAQGNMQADALLAPELLSTMAGGPGSGVRMNEAEIARIVGGRTAWENLKASMQRWSLDSSTARSITPEQDRQIRALVNAVQGKLTVKLGVIQRANDALIVQGDSSGHRQVLADAQRTLERIDLGRYLTENQIQQVMKTTGKTHDEVVASAQRQDYAILP